MSKLIQNAVIQEVLAEDASASQPEQRVSITLIEARDSLLSTTVDHSESSPKESLIQLAQKMGWRLIRLSGKIPIDKGWPASTGLTVDEAIQHPEKLGIICGEPSGRLFIVDIDGEKPEGLSVTPTVRTGSGGQHLYYHLPEGIELTKASKVNHVAPGVDIRWTGGQIVAPGSIHPDTGGLYNWVPGLSPDDVPMADVPQWVLDVLKTRIKHVPLRIRTRETVRHGSAAR